MRTKKLISSVMCGTKLPSIHIAATKGQATCLDSRFGGIFYLPRGEKIPVCPEGEEMQFLAQINFAQIPTLKGFPRKGILQFFVDTDAQRFQNKMEDDTLKRELYAVRYYPQPEEHLQQEIIEQSFTASQTIKTVILGDERLSMDEYQKRCQNGNGKPLQQPKFEFRQTKGHLDLPWLKGKMLFQKKKEIVTISFGADSFLTDLGYEYAKKKISSYLFPLLLKVSGYDIEYSETDTDDFCWDFGNYGCKLGGHPAVRQWDIRSENEKNQKYTTLLFQYDLSTRDEIEQDTFNFFIKPEDLAACRFDDVLLCWHNCF